MKGFSFASLLKNVKDFLLAALLEVGGPDAKALYEACVPPAWKGNVSGADDEGSAGSFGETAEKVLDIVGKIIGLACKFKSQIKKFLGARRMMLQLMRYRRFLERKGFIKSAWNSVKKGAQALGHAVVDGLKAIGGGVMEAFHKVKDWINNMINSIKKFFNSPFMKNMISFLSCLIPQASKVPKIVKRVKDIVTGFMNKIKQLSTGIPGVVGFIVDLICNFNCLRESVRHLVAAIRTSSVAKGGAFVGSLVVCIATA